MSQAKKVMSISVVEKAVELLQILSEGEQEWPVSALAEKAGISRNKTVRLLASLERMGLVEHTGLPGKYYVGPGALVLGQKLLRHATLINHARPVMESLAMQHNEAMYLTILKDDDVLFLDMVDCHWQVKAESFVGKRFPFFCNAAGKVMRAIDSFDLVERLGKKWRGGQGDCPDFSRLQAELARIREEGVAVDCGGMGDGIITVAVAVKDYAGKVIGSLTMLGPSFRLLGERLEKEIIPSLRSGGELLSMKFGYARP